IVIFYLRSEKRKLPGRSRGDRILNFLRDVAAQYQELTDCAETTSWLILHPADDSKSTARQNIFRSRHAPFGVGRLAFALGRTSKGSQERAGAKSRECCRASDDRAATSPLGFQKSTLHASPSCPYHSAVTRSFETALILHSASQNISQTLRIFCFHS